MPGHSDWRVYERLLWQARPYWPHLVVVFVVHLLSVPLALLMPLPLKIGIDNVIGSHPLPGMLRWILPAWDNSSTAALLWLSAGLLVSLALLLALQALAVWLLESYTGR